MQKIQFYDAVIEIHKNKALDKITIRDICEYLEISKGTIYYHFKNKNDLLKQMFIEFKRLSTSSAINCQGDLKEKITSFIEYNKENNQRYKFIFSGEISDFIDEEIKEEIEKNRILLLQTFKIDPVSHEYLAAIIYGTLSTYLCNEQQMNLVQEQKLINTLVDLIQK